MMPTTRMLDYPGSGVRLTRAIEETAPSTTSWRTAGKANKWPTTDHRTGRGQAWNQPLPSGEVSQIQMPSLGWQLA